MHEIPRAFKDRTIEVCRELSAVMNNTLEFKGTSYLSALSSLKTIGNKTAGSVFPELVGAVRKTFS